MKEIIRQKGAAMVEFALVLPLFLVLVFGVLEFGIMLYDKALITNTSREIARSNIALRAPAATGAQLITQSTNIRNNYCSMAINFASGATCTVSLYYNGSTTALTSTGASVITASQVPLKVEVNYTYTTLIIGALLNLIGDGSFSNTINLSATTTMLTE
jgi:Flp pilus assembly protein TadG